MAVFKEKLVSQAAYSSKAVFIEAFSVSSPVSALVDWEYSNCLKIDLPSSSSGATGAVGAPITISSSFMGGTGFSFRAGIKTPFGLSVADTLGTDVFGKVGVAYALGSTRSAADGSSTFD